jgi:phosphoglycolate phosphatase
MAPILLCDLDGTLVDTVQDLTAVLNRLLAESDLAPLSEAQVRQIVGRGMPRLVADGFSLAGRPLADSEWDPAVARFMAMYNADPAAHTAVYPGVPETLDTLARAGWRIAVCTNKPEAPTAAILEALDLARFVEAIGAGDSFPARKPAGAHLHATLERMHGDPAAAVMVGDSRIDLRAARNAGVPIVLVGYGYGDPDLAPADADAWIDRFDALPGALAGLRAVR